MEHVKEAVESAVTTAEHSLGSMVNKVSNSIALPSADKNDDQVEDLVRQVETTAVETIATSTEAVSEAETVLASEKENVGDFVLSTRAAALKKMNSLTDEFGEVILDAKENISDGMHIEDVEQSMDTLENNYKDMKKKAEDLVNGVPSSPPASTVTTEKEETTIETKEE